VPINNVPGGMQMAIIDLKCNKGLKAKYNNVELSGFYSKYTDRKQFSSNF
jgi:hypothetical protein